MRTERSTRPGVPPFAVARTLAPLLAALLLLSCGSGSFTSPEAVLTLYPDAVPFPGVQLDLGEGSGGATVDLRLLVGGPESFYRARYELAYPADLLRVVSVTEGPFLSEGGVVETRLTSRPAPGLVSIDHTRVGDVGALTQPSLFSTMLVIRMTAIANGTGRLLFTAHEVFDDAGETVPGYTWGGALVEVEL